MFRNKSLSSIDLDEQIRFFIGSDGKSHIVDLLKATKDFLTATTPDFMVQRQSKQNAELLAIFTKVGDGLQSFQNAPNHAANDDIYLQCVETINERIELLKFKEDRLFELYKHHENPLKTHLQTVTPHVNYKSN